MHRLVCRPKPDRETTILIGAGIRSGLVAEVEALGKDRQVVALVDPAVTEYHPPFLPETWRVLQVEGGERAKSFATLELVLRQMARWRLDRRSLVVAVGGGTIGDLAGLVASLYLRGVELIQVPTTLLAMLDSSVGGKTAINIEEGKNLVGSFWPPHTMLADVELARSLPRDHLLSGLAEAIKMAIGFNGELFTMLEGERDPILAGESSRLSRVVAHAVADKIGAVESDPLEQLGPRRCLNLGHTLAHALEALSDFTLLHGHAVAQGLHFALDVAERLNVMDPEPAARSHALLEHYGFSRTSLPDSEALRPFFERDKKMEANLLHFVVPTAIGACRTEALEPGRLLELGTRSSG